MPSDDLKECFEVKTDVEILKRDVGSMEGLLSRLDTAIDKIADASNSISKILAVHEATIDELKSDAQERQRMAEKENELLHRRITDMKDESSEQREKHHRELIRIIENLESQNKKSLDKINERVTILERWKWWVMGAAGAIGYIIAKYPTLSQIIN